MKHKVLIAVVLLSTILCGFFSPQVKSTYAASVHAGIFFNQQELDNLKILKNSSSHKAIWAGLKGWADTHLTDLAPTSIGSNWSNAVEIKRYLENMGFIYAMTNDTSYANAAKKWALPICKWENWGTGSEAWATAPIITMGIAFYYDVAYDFLSNSERTVIRNAMINNMNNDYQYVSQNPNNSYSDFPNGLNVIGGGLGLAGLVLEGEYSNASEWINIAKTLVQRALDAGGRDGGWFEGPAYAQTFNYSIPFIDALKRIKGINLFENDFLKELPYYFIYTTYNNSYMPLEDSGDVGSWALRSTVFLYRLASEYGNKYAQGFADIGAKSLLDSLAWNANYSAIGMYIWKNPNVSSKSSDDLALVKYFDSIGYVISRTGWTTSDHVFVFKSGTSQGHAHADQNSWSLFGPVNESVISGNPGYIGGTVYDKTSSANTILANGLGQAQEPGDYSSAPLGTRGIIQQVDIQSEYTYIRGDAHSTYLNKSNTNSLLTSGDLSKWLRNVVIMQSPFYFVIFDDVAATKNEQFDWVFQGNGGTFTTKDNTITLKHQENLNAVILEPSLFSTQTITDTNITKYAQLRVHPSSNSKTAEFLSAFSLDTMNSYEKIKQNNLIGTVININENQKDLVLFSSDGEPVDEWIELGAYYTSRDSKTYNINGTKVKAAFSKYQVIRLEKNNAPVPEYLIINPSNTSVIVGDTVSFTAQGYDNNNNIINDLKFNWSLNDQNAGLIDSNGIFTAGSVPGNYINTVVVDYGGKTESTSITITEPDINHIEVTPSESAAVNGLLNLESFGATGAIGSDSIGIVVPEGGKAAFEAQAYDNANNPINGLTYTWKVMDSSAGTINTKGLFSASNNAGTYYNAIQASTVNGVAGTASVTVVQSPLADIGNKSVTEGQLLEFKVSNEGDYSGLTFSGLNMPVGASFNAGTKVFSWTPSLSQAGDYEVTFRATDGIYLDSETVSISVVDSNQAPVLNSIGNKTGKISSKLSFTISGSDPDGGSLTYSASNLPSGASFNASTRTFSWTPTSRQAGTYSNVRFQVSDGKLTDAESITIKIAAKNTAPVMGALSNQTVYGGNLLTFKVTATDADGDSLRFTASNLPSGAKFDTATQTFSWTPATSLKKTYTNVKFSVSDGTATVSRAISITVKQANVAPTLNKIGDKSIKAGASTSFTVTGKDSNGDRLTYSASNLPAGASFNPSTRKFTWRPSYSQNGTYPGVTFRVSDGSLSASESITITVSSTVASPSVGTTNNSAPVMGDLSNQTVYGGNLLTFNVTATDVDGDKLTYSASNLPSGSKFDSATQTFSWTPAASLDKTYTNVKFSVSDGKTIVSKAISITVKQANAAPTLNTIGNKSIRAGSYLSFTVTGKDSNGDRLTYSASNLPAGASFNPSTRKFTWRPSYTQKGTYSGVVFQVSDGEYTTSQSITITVK